jgi:hypothetical protein
MCIYIQIANKMGFQQKKTSNSNLILVFIQELHDYTKHSMITQNITYYQADPIINHCLLSRILVKAKT